MQKVRVPIGYFSSQKVGSVKSKQKKEDWNRKRLFLNKIYQIQSYIEDGIIGKYTCFKGSAHSRIEHDFLVGNCEYELNKYKWPEGYIAHYVEKHNLKPPDHFVKWVLNFDFEADNKCDAILNIIDVLTVTELKRLANELKIAGYTKMKKEQLKEQIHQSVKTMCQVK